MRNRDQRLKILTGAVDNFVDKRVPVASKEHAHIGSQFSPGNTSGSRAVSFDQVKRFHKNVSIDEYRVPEPPMSTVNEVDPITQAVRKRSRVLSNAHY